MNCAEHNMWSKQQKLVYLKSLLDKDVANILWDYDKEESVRYPDLREF